MGLPRTIFISTNLGDDAIKLVEVLKELKYCTQSVENKVENEIPFKASHSLISTYLGRTTIVFIEPLTSCELIYGSHKNKGLNSEVRVSIRTVEYL